ncbi:MAG: porin [Succinivibrionaceae bacterium]
MKKLLLVSFLCISTFGTAQAATVFKNDTVGLDVGGRVQGNLNSVNASEKNNGKVTLDGKVRLRTSGYSQITDGIKAIEFTEWEVAAASSQDGKFKTRYAYLGFKTDNYGQLVFGQNHTAAYNVFGKTDIFTDFTYKKHTYWDLGGRQEGQAIYQIKKSGFLAAASYQTAVKNLKNGYAAALGYEFNKDFPVSINFGIDSYNFDAYENTIASDDRTTFYSAVSAGTNGNGLYGAVLYTITDYDKAEDKNAVEVVGSYTWDNGIKFMGAYRYQEQDSATLVSEIASELSYNFTPNFKVFTEAQIGLGDIDKVDNLGKKTGSTKDRSPDKFSVALQYNF